MWQISCFFFLFQLFSTKNIEKLYFHKHLECAAPKHWSKYTIEQAPVCWSKYTTTVVDFFRLSTTAIQSYVTNGEEKLLPSLTLCPITSYKTKGSFFNMETVLNNTFAMEKIFSPTTIKMLKNESVYSVKDVFSVLLGRCFMVTRHAI